MAASSSVSMTLLLLFVYFSFLLLGHAAHDSAFKSIDLGHPAEDIFPSSLSGASDMQCDRVRISGLSRLKLGSFASAFRVTAVPSVVIPERQHAKIQVCFHWNNSLGLCQCGDDEWKTFQKGVWSSTMSPYEIRYVDVKVLNVSPLSGPVTIAIEEEFQQWRLLCLALGFMLLLLAPVISSWVPFYYSSSMAIGIFLVVLIILFQGMKLLPTGRKNVFYLAVYGSVLGAGSYLAHHFAMFVNSILLSFGLKEEMHNPVAIFLLLGIVLSGAALGYWIPHLSFRVLLMLPLALGAFVCCWTACYLISSLKQSYTMNRSYSEFGGPWQRQNIQIIGNRTRPEFLSRSSPQDRRWRVSDSHRPGWSNSPVHGLISPSSGMQNQDYYSTFHKTRNRKKFTKKAWDDFTRDSTRHALAEWASSPEFTDWIMEHADRIQLLPSESSDETVDSESHSTNENVVGSGSRFSFLNCLQLWLDEGRRGSFDTST
ncbi:hypothetical protein SDJN03_12027, partial [Cucurbita argyrosperma subsp. sororia]